MRMDDYRHSDNVEDRRGSRMGGGGVRLGGGRLGLGTIAIALIASYFLGLNPLTVINMLAGGGMPAIEQQAPAAPPADDPTAQFVSKVLASTEDTWNTAFREMGRQYQEPKLVLFSGLTPTACGTGQSAMGPFYCPGDQKVYIDLSFFREMKEKFRAPGEFAQAYVVAHEVGHHVQHLLGISDQVQRARQQAGEKEANALSVRLELQADCLAGVWANAPTTWPTSSTPVIYRLPSLRRRPLATTVCSNKRRGVSCRKALPTVARSSACAGSSAVLTVAISTSATPSTTARCNPFALAALAG